MTLSLKDKKYNSKSWQSALLKGEDIPTFPDDGSNLILSREKSFTENRKQLAH
jgi:hypothetical protein